MWKALIRSACHDGEICGCSVEEYNGTLSGISVTDLKYRIKWYWKD